MTGLERSFRRIGASITAFVSARSIYEGAKAVAGYADAWKVATNQVAAASSIADRQARSMSGINKIANDTRTGLAETAELYAKLLRSTKDVADSEEQVARATALMNMAFKAGGASTSETINGIRQLSQALGSGLLQGDELRSIRENAPLLAQAIADEFETTIAGLKKLGSEGKLTSDRVFKAILSGAAPIEKAFAATNATIAESFTILDNSITEYVGKTDAATGASVEFARGIKMLADNFDQLADQVLGSNSGMREYLDLISELKLLWATLKQNVQPTGELGDAFQALKSALEGTDNPLGNFANRMDGIRHPLNAFIKQIRDAVQALNLLAGAQRSGTTSIPKTPAAPNLFDAPKTFKPTITGVGEPTDDQRKYAESLAVSTSQTLALVNAATRSKGEFERFKDIMDATNEVIKTGIPINSELGLSLIQLGVAARQADRDIENIRTAIEDTDNLNAQSEQYVALADAMRLGGREFRALHDHIEILNEAQEKNIDITTAQGQAWLAAREKAQQFEKGLDEVKTRTDELAATINQGVDSGIGMISSSFADAVVEAENLRDTLNNLLKDLAKLALDMTFQFLLKQGIGGVGTSTQAGSGLLGLFHGGGIVGKTGVPHRSLPAAMLAGAPRFHGGLMPGEFPAILQKGEGVFTPEQMKAMRPGGGVTINIIDNAGNDVSTKQRQGSNGLEIDVFIDRTGAQKLGQPGSDMQKVMSRGYGVRPVLTRR